MNKHRLFRLALVALICLAAPRPAAARTIDAVLADLKANTPPRYDAAAAKADPTYRAQYMKTTATAQTLRSALIAELFHLAPDAPELTQLLPERWRTLRLAHQGATAVLEINAYLAAHPDSSIKAATAFTRATLELEQIAKDAPVRQAVIAEFEAASPGDAHLPDVLKQAFDAATDPAERDAYLARLQKDFPQSRQTKFVEGLARTSAAIGKPFELAFKDVLTNKPISIKDLKGKVVVIDFWATWCGPCMGEMPNMKKLYAQYKDQGVEFIGVSLDQPGPGLDKLKTCLATNAITWPQYYQGNGWDSAFSVSWGLSSIPRLFVIDAQGNLADLNARGKLETLLPKLLKDAPPQDPHQVASP